MNTHVNKDLQSESPASTGNKSILVAEDNDVNFMVFEAFLMDWGYEITRANNGKEAVEMVSHKKFDLVMMDLYMPEMNGVDAIKNIRKLGHSMPILVLTASSVEKDLKDSLTNGANDFLLKPVSGARLKEKLAQYIG